MKARTRRGGFISSNQAAAERSEAGDESRNAAALITRGASPLALLLLSTLLLTGCIGDPAARDPAPPPRDLPRLSYAEIAQRYNRNLAPLDRLWSRSDLVVRWIEQDGDERAESGDGHFIYVPPRRVALTLGKLGKTVLWAGSNDDHYWLIDNLDDGVAYVGDHGPDAPDAIHAPARNAPPGPLPFRPNDVGFLLGLRPLDASPPAGRPGYAYVAPARNAYLIITPDRRVRLRLEPDRLLPVRVELFDPRGRVVAVSELSNHQPLDTPGLPDARRPRLATDAWLYAGETAASNRPDRRESMHLELSGLSAAAHRVRPGVFDLDTLLDRYDPARVERLDAPATRRLVPATSPIPPTP